MLQRAREAVAAAAAAPASAEAHDRLAHLLQAANDPAGSLKMFTAAVALRKQSSEDLRTVGVDYVMLNDTADAHKWLRASIALNAGNAECLDMTWAARNDHRRLRPGRKGDATGACATTGIGKAENNLGLALEALNQPEDAEAAYRRAVQLQAASRTAVSSP